MGQNLGPLNIKDTYQSLVQISGSQITDGSGSLISSVDIAVSSATSASYSATATSASYSEVATSASYASNASTADSATSASYSAVATSASYAATATTADSATTATSASHAVQADSATTATTATTATSASYALTASYLEGGVDPFPYVGAAVITGSLTVTETSNVERIIVDAEGTNGGRVLSGRGNSILQLGVDQTSQRDLITLGANASVGFYGNASQNFNNPYGWFKDKGWISGSLAVNQAFTASGLIYPSTDGTTGQVMTTDGAGNLSFTTVSGGGGADAGLISGSAPNSLLSANYTTTNAIADGSGSIAIGDAAQVTGSTSENTVVIGKDANSKENSVRNVLIGYNTYMNEPNRNDSVIIGANAHGYQEGVAVGANAFTIYQAVAVGKDAYTNDNYGVAVGAGARTNNNGGIAIGSGSLQDGDGSIAIGKGAHATATGDVVINNSYADVYTYDSSSNTTTLLGVLAIDGITDVSASIASAGGGGAAFPYTGSAGISGSLNVVGFIDSIGTTYGPDGTDFRNMLIGSGSGVSMTTGIRNVCIGSPYTTWGAQLDAAGSFLTQGSNNTLVGNGTGCRMTTGNNNAFFGQLSGGGTTTGQSNTGIGYGGLRDNNGSYNTGVGHWAGYGASGQNGVMIGYRTGFGNSGWRNIIIGANAVGQGASLTTHDKLVIGQDLTATDNLIYGYHGADTTPGDRFLTVKGLINAGQYSADPTGAGVQAGSIYYNTTTNKLKCYNGSTWNDLF